MVEIGKMYFDLTCFLDSVHRQNGWKYAQAYWNK